MVEDRMVNGGEEREGQVFMPHRRLFICKYCERRFTSSHAFCGHQNSHRKERAAMKEPPSRHNSTLVPIRPTVPSNNSPIITSSMQSSVHLCNKRFQPYSHPRFIPPPPGHPILCRGPSGGYGPPRRNAAAAAAADSMGSKLARGPVMRRTLYALWFEALVKVREAAAEAEKKDEELQEEELDLTLHL